MSDEDDALGEIDPVRERVKERAAAALALADEALARDRPYAGAGDAWAAGMPQEGLDNVKSSPAASPSPAPPPRVLTRRDGDNMMKAVGRAWAEEQRDREALEKRTNDQLAAMAARLVQLEARLASAESRLTQAENTKAKRK
jgi:hypothetical protein